MIFIQVDANKKPPKFETREWVIEVNETIDDVIPATPILTVNAAGDKDKIGGLIYSIVESSGFGADKFTILKNDDGSASIRIKKPLDFEDPLQKFGFRFKISVSDQRANVDKNYIDYSWVAIKLLDVNENKLKFRNSYKEIPVYEDSNIGTTIDQVNVQDQGIIENVIYEIDPTSDPYGMFRIDDTGTIKIQRKLDREKNPRHNLKVFAFSDNTTAIVATVTLNIIVMDVNDNAPRLFKNHQAVLMENQFPTKIAEILAVDDDESSKLNGPPFYFRLSPYADDNVRGSFKVEYDPKGSNGDGMALISSIRSFDREYQKEYHLPIVIRDSGKPVLSATSTFTVIIGDQNDNKMRPGSKSILVYNYAGNYTANSEIPIGRVHVTDPDDWDLSDKKFTWAKDRHPNFFLNEDNGMISMIQHTPENFYFLTFHVHDSKFNQAEVEANVTVQIKEVSEEAVKSAGFVRLSDITAENFVRIWDYKRWKETQSKYQKFREKIATLLNTDIENVDIFSIEPVQVHSHHIDVLFSVRSSPISYYDSTTLNQLVFQHREEIENSASINITMISSDHCFSKKPFTNLCTTNREAIVRSHVMTNANMTSFVGLRTIAIPESSCNETKLTEELCYPNPCLNGGRCIRDGKEIHCDCPYNAIGSRCHVVTHTMNQNAMIWFYPTKMCNISFIRAEFITGKTDWLVYDTEYFLNLGMDVPLLPDFISLELINGLPQFLINLDSEIRKVKIDSGKALNNGEWHRIDVVWNEKVT